LEIVSCEEWIEKIKIGKKNYPLYYKISDGSISMMEKENMRRKIKER
jgi:hypothetical protein